MALHDRIEVYKRLLGEITTKEKQIKKNREDYFKRVDSSGKTPFDKNVAKIEYERKVVDVEKDKIIDIKKKVLRMEKDFNVEVNLGDLMDEIKQLTKTPDKKLVIEIDEIPFFWGKRTSNRQVEEFFIQRQANAKLSITIYHADYYKGKKTTNKSMCYVKETLLEPTTRFKSGTLKDNIKRTENGFKIANPRNVFVHFTLRDFAHERYDWKPVEIMEKALTNTLEKRQNKINIIN